VTNANIVVAAQMVDAMSAQTAICWSKAVVIVCVRNAVGASIVKGFIVKVAFRIQCRPNWPGDGESGDAIVFEGDGDTVGSRFKSWNEAVLYAFSWLDPDEAIEKMPDDESYPK
jgi:hypothetical protein